MAGALSQNGSDEAQDRTLGGASGFDGPGQIRVKASSRRGKLPAMSKPTTWTLPLLTLAAFSTALADSPGCANLKLSRTSNGLAALLMSGEVFGNFEVSAPFYCKNTTITSRSGVVTIKGKTFADAVKQANRLQPYLYRYGRDNTRVIKVVFSTNAVTVNPTKYPLGNYEAIGFSLDQGDTMAALLLEGKVYSPRRFSADDVVLVYTDTDSGVWSEAWLNPQEKTVIFRP